jgi:hypothetical protein
MADRKPGIMCASRLGEDWIDGGTMCRSRTSSPGILGTVLSLATGAVPASPPSDAEAFKTAIDLFRETPASKSPHGARVLAKLEESLLAGNISYGGDNSSNSGTGKIQIEASYRGDIANTSISLVHEGFHVAINLDPYIDDELASRDIQAEYGAYLFANPTRVGGQTYQLKREPYLAEVKRKDQVVDYVIGMYYGSQPDFTITKDWILKHQADWKGLCNRTTKTRKIYAKILVDSQPTASWNPLSIDPAVAAALFELLECAPGDSKEILAHAGEEDAMTVLRKLPATYKERYSAWESKKGLGGPPTLKEYQPSDR